MLKSIFAGTRVEAFEALEKKTEVIRIILTKNSKLYSHLKKNNRYLKNIKVLNEKNKIECFEIIKKTKAKVFLSAGFPFIIPYKYFDKKS